MMFDQLEDALGLVPASIPVAIENDQLPAVVQEVTPPTIAPEREEAKTALKSVLKKADVALDLMMDIAKESEHPRAFEVLATLLNTVSDTAMKLDKLGEPTQKQAQEGPKTVNQNLFVGTTDELMKLIKQQQQTPK